MSRATFKRLDGDAVYHALQKRRREKKKEYMPIPPGPNDLTVEKIMDRMSRIYVGDMIKFDSMKACYTVNQVDRGSTTIIAVGTVAEHCGGYLMVRLEHGLLESVNYFDIISVNGKSWPWHIKRDCQPEVIVVGDSTWR